MGGLINKAFNTFSVIVFISPLYVSAAQCSSLPGCSEPGPGFSWSTLGVWASPAGARDHPEFWIWQCPPCLPWCAASGLQPGPATERLWTSCPCLCHRPSQPCHARDVQPLIRVWRGEPSTRSKKTLVLMGALLWRVLGIVSSHPGQVMQPWSLRLVQLS